MSLLLNVTETSTVHELYPPVPLRGIDYYLNEKKHLKEGYVKMHNIRITESRSAGQQRCATEYLPVAKKVTGVRHFQRSYHK